MRVEKGGVTQQQSHRYQIKVTVQLKLWSPALHVACERPQPWKRINKMSLNSSSCTFFPLARQQAVPIDVKPRQQLQVLPFSPWTRRCCQGRWQWPSQCSPKASSVARMIFCPEDVRCCRNGFHSASRMENIIDSCASLCISLPSKRCVWTMIILKCCLVLEGSRLSLGFTYSEYF